MKHGFVKVAAMSPEIRLADCAFNARATVEMMRTAAELGVKVALFPELGLTGATCGDLFLQKTLQRAALDALGRVCEASEELDMVVTVGLPLDVSGNLYNCAAVVQQGEILGFVPKAAVRGVFMPGPAAVREIRVGVFDYPFGQDIVFRCHSLPELRIAVEIGEEGLSLFPPSDIHAAAGASVILNPAADFELAGRAETRRVMVKAQSKRIAAAYIRACAGAGESTTDGVFSGHGLIAENGKILAEGKPFEQKIVLSEIDTEALIMARQSVPGFGSEEESHAEIIFPLITEDTVLTRAIDRLPFVPSARERDDYCREIIEIQAEGLKRRMLASQSQTALIGVSGGLDSALALVATHRAFEKLGRDSGDIVALSMPCFGTSGRTRENSRKLCGLLGCNFREIDISESVRLHFRDIGHDFSDRSVAFENAQARERTQVLMDTANMMRGLVVGTGDLSELALGWATYNGDHMSMYNLNGSVPKTLVRAVLGWYAQKAAPELRAVLDDIIDTPVSPELLPSDGGAVQSTEEILGPYELHDFFLYHMLTDGSSPEKIFRLASIAFEGEYDVNMIVGCLDTFVRRFFQQQFKRSCSPDGPQAGPISLSPRGGLRMPSDASASLWQAEIERLKDEIFNIGG